MAELPEAAEEALKKITSQLECSICHATYSSPKQLPCFHTFCKKCLERLVVQDHNVHTLTCPEDYCRKTTSLPPTGVSGMQTAFHINHLLEIYAVLTKVKEQQRIHCEMCSEKSTATDFCRVCGGFMCAKCKLQHRLANHQIASLNDIHQEAANLVPPTSRVMDCPKHPREEIKVYCETCRELICDDCTIRLHRECDCAPVTDTFQKHKEEIVSSLQSMKQQLATVEKVVMAFDIRKKEIEEQEANIKADIHKRIELLCKALEQREEELTSQLRQKTQQKLHDLVAQRDKCELVHAQLNIHGFLDYMEGSLKTCSEVEILAMKKPVLNHIEQITDDFHPNEAAPQQEADIQLLTDDTLDLQISCQGFAEVVAGHSVCCSKSYATGEGLTTATVSEETTVTLHTKDKDDGVCDALHQDAHVSGSLVCTRDSTRVKCDTKREGKSTYTVSYRPTTRGRHKLHLKIDGNIVKGSPHTVIVRPNLQDLGNPVKVIPGLNRPWGMTTDSKGRIIVTESSGNQVSIISPKWDKKIQSLGSGSSSSAEGHFNHPTGVTVDDDDNIYVVDYWNHRIQKFSSDGQFVKSVGKHGSESLQFSHPHDIGFNKKNGKLYVCDQVNQRIHILTTDLDLDIDHRSFGSENRQFDFPHNIAFDTSGDVYVTDDQNRIQVFSPNGQYKTSIGHKIAGELIGTGVAIDGDRVYVTEGGNHRISVFSTEGTFLTSFGHKGNKNAQFHHPQSVYVSRDGFILIADCDNDRIQVF